MRCDDCVSDGAKHTVSEGMSGRTLMSVPSGHWDEDDNWIQPRDPNFITTRYSCSNGHRWQISKGGYLDEPRVLKLPPQEPPKVVKNAEIGLESGATIAIDKDGEPTWVSPNPESTEGHRWTA